MQVSEVRVTKSFTRNLGNFESARVEYGMTVSVDADDVVDEVKAKLSAKVEKWITEDINEIDADGK